MAAWHARREAGRTVAARGAEVLAFPDRRRPSRRPPPPASPREGAGHGLLGPVHRRPRQARRHRPGGVLRRALPPGGDLRATAARPRSGPFAPAAAEAGLAVGEAALRYAREADGLAGTAEAV
jgi:hypothetical protein